MSVQLAESGKFCLAFINIHSKMKTDAFKAADRPIKNGCRKMRSGTSVDPHAMNRAPVGIPRGHREYVHEKRPARQKKSIVRCAVYVFQFHMIEHEGVS